MKLTTKGQVTIPKNIRRFLGVAAHSEVEFQIREGLVVVVPKRGEPETTQDVGSRFRALQGSRKVGPMTDEWLDSTRCD